MTAELPIHKAMRLHKAGKLDKARQVYRKILKKTPDSVDALHYYGVLHFQEGKIPKALEMIQRALELNPTYPDAYNNLGNILLKLGDFDQARSCYENVLALAPDRIETHNNLGVLLRNLGELESSAASLQKAVTMAPDWADAHYNFANTLAQLGNKEAALAQYRKATELSPKFAVALKRLGAMLYTLGRVDEAIEIYRGWLELEPDNPIAQHMLAATSGENTPARSSVEFVVTTFDQFADSFDSQLERLEYRAPRLVIDALVDLIGDETRDLSIVDAGCGTGLCGPLLRPLARQLVGVDLSSGMLAQARERACYDRLVQDDLVTHLRSYNKELDAVVSADTLVYFGDLREPLRAVSAALIKSGSFIFSVEKSADDHSGFQLEAHGRYSHGRDYIEQCLNEAGLEVIRITETTLRKELGEPVAGWLVVTRRLD